MSYASELVSGCKNMFGNYMLYNISRNLEPAYQFSEVEITCELKHHGPILEFQHWFH